MTPARLTRLALPLLLALVGALLLPTSAPAFPYVFKTTFATSGSGDGQLQLGPHSGLAVNTTTHDVYVADTENHRVVVFDQAGAFLRAFGADVGGPGVDVCTTGCGPGTAEDAPGAFVSPTFIAIDNNPLSPSFEDVYVADNGTNTVSKFEADGDLIASWGVSGQLDGSASEKFDQIDGQHVEKFGVTVELAGIAVDNSGNLFVKQTGVGGFIFKFDQAGTFLDEFTTTFKTNPQTVAPMGIAVDSTGAIYTVRGTEVVAKLNPAGEPIVESIGCEACTRAIAVDSSNDDLYVAQQQMLERYDSAGVLQETFGSLTGIAEASGIAVDAGLETAYIVNPGAGADRIDVFGPKPPEPPEIVSASADAITATEADLHARVNPNKLATRARFQYVTQEQFEASGFTGAAQTPELDLGSGKAIQEAEAHLGGLLPDTTYRFRVLAENELGLTVGPEPPPGFTTFATPPAVLPDGRAYEMVSPQRKAGEVLPPEPSTQLGGSCGDCLPGANSPVMPMQSAPDGNSVLYLGQPFFAGLASGPNEYLAPRTPNGWGTQSQSSAVTIGAYEAFSPDLSRGVLWQVEPPLSPEAPTRGGSAFGNVYLREGGLFQPLLTEEPPSRNPADFRIRFATANKGTAFEPGFGHLLFEADDALTQAIPGIAPVAPEVDGGGICTLPGVECNLYEWHEGELALVNVLPGNADAATAAVIGAGRLLGSGDQHPDVDHAISDDGSRVFFSSEETGEVYVRVDGEQTLEIPTPGPGTCKAGEPRSSRVCFLTASADGTSVLLSDGQIFELNEAGSAYQAGDDLSQGGAGFEGILGAAEDLSRVYFLDTEALTEEAEENQNGEHAEAGRPNLYGWDRGELTFLGRLLPGDGNFNAPEYGAWRASPSHRTAQVSADGSWLAFTSLASLTDYDNDLRGGGNCNTAGPACREVFVYSADSGTLTCASCNPTGQQPLGDSNLSLLRPGPSRPSGPPFPQPGNLAPDGSGRLFFESQDRLSPRDVNGHIQDVYEWEPQGVGSCQRPDGCVYLISSGQSPNDSMFMDASDSGEDAFFITRERLLPRDRDDQLDLYDARVGGGFAEPLDEPCLGEACRGPLSEVPEPPAPGSPGFVGEGNLRPPKPCGRGFVRRHRRCIKKKRKRDRAHRDKHHKSSRPRSR